MVFFVYIVLFSYCGTFFVGYRLATYAPGKYASGLVVFGVAVHSRLFLPPGIFNLDILACLYHMKELHNL